MKIRKSTKMLFGSIAIAAIAGIFVSLLIPWVAVSKLPPEIPAHTNLTSRPLLVEAIPHNYGFPFDSFTPNIVLKADIAPGATVQPSPLVNTYWVIDDPEFLPLWHGLVLNAFVFSLACLLILWLAKAGWSCVQARNRVCCGQCPNCGYNLRDENDYCPECGGIRRPSS